MVYSTTVHMHCSRKTAHRRKIILTMTLLYALYIFNIGGTCYVLYWRFIENGAFYSLIESGLERLETSIAMTPWLCAFLADALMVSGILPTVSILVGKMIMILIKINLTGMAMLPSMGSFLEGGSRPYIFMDSGNR